MIKCNFNPGDRSISISISISIYLSIYIYIYIFLCVCVEVGKKIQKFTWKCKGLKIARPFLRKKIETLWNCHRVD